jgi:hypothetical protein
MKAVLLCLNMIILFMINSCSLDNKEVQGIYVGNFSNNIDSIKISNNGLYERVIYDNKKRLIFKNKSTYKLKNGNISFDNFLLNEDDLNDKVKYNENDLLNANLSYNKNLVGSIKIFVDYDNEYYYIKK